MSYVAQSEGVAGGLRQKALPDSRHMKQRRMEALTTLNMILMPCECAIAMILVALEGVLMFRPSSS